MATDTLPATRPAASAPAASPAIPPEPAFAAPGPGAAVLGTAVGVASEALLFGALVATVLLLRRAPGQWPPGNVHLNNYLGNVLALTALMISGSAQWALYAARRGDTRNTTVGLALTLGLGLALLNGVWYSLQHAGFGPGDHAYGVVYFVLVGAYVVNVIGAGALSVMATVRAVGAQFSAEEHAMVTAHALVWHFLALTWLTIWYFIWVLK